jgi:uncharacterized protein (DUF2267 family)
MHELIERVVLHSGLDDEAARRATEAVLAGLRRELGRPEAEALANELPADLADVARHGRYSGDRDLASWVAAEEHLSPAAAIEHAASVCRALAELLTPTTLERLRRALPPKTATLLEPSSTERREHRSHGGTTLADARPGSRHPVSEAAPARAQADSVVASDNPHGDTKLSTSRGLTQEREHESIAEGHPGASRPIADSHER